MLTRRYFPRASQVCHRIRKRIDSETLTLPELRSFIGRTVEIVIEEKSAAELVSKSVNSPSR